VLLNQTSLKKDTVKRGSPLLQIKTEETPLQRLSRETPCMPKKKLTPEQGKKLLEETKKRIRLGQEARTQARLEQLDFEACEKLGKELYKQYWDLEKELEKLCAELDWSDEEETTPPLPNLTNTENKEESSSSNNFSK
jgi:hypothetical protein